MDRTDLIKVAVEDRLKGAFANSKFTPEVMKQVDEVIKARIEYYKEYYKDNPQARAFAEKFTQEEIGTLGTYKTYRSQLISDKVHNFKVNSFLRTREYIIKYFYEPGLTYEQMREKFLQDKFNNPRKYNLTDTHKKRILKDWAKHFPEMAPFKSKYTYHSLIKMVGPFILEISIERSRLHKDQYSPGIWIQHLLLPMNQPSLSVECSYDDHFWEIPVIDHHEGFYTDVIDIVREKFWLPLEGDITLEQICKIKEFKSIMIKSLAFSWAGRKDLAIEFRDTYLNVLKKLRDSDPDYYKENAKKRMQSFNIEYDPNNVEHTWENKFIEIIDNPDFIRETVRNNVKKFGAEFGLNIIPYQDIADAPYKEKNLR